MAKFRVSQRFQLFNQTHKSEILNLLNGSSALDIMDSAMEVADRENIFDESICRDPLDEDAGSVITEEKRSSEIQLPESDEKKEVGLHCTTCNVKFSTLNEQRQHFRLDWHRYNLKRKSHNQLPVNEDEFQDMMDGLSSISGSDGEDSVATDNPLSRLLKRVTVDELDEKDSNKEKQSELVLKYYSKLFYKTKGEDVFCFYEAILPFSKVRRDAELLEKVLPHVKETVESHPCWGIIMISGGHFAAGIFKGTAEVIHKTFHSYTVRAKQGGAQGSRDNKSATSHCKSAGASLRRYNEQVFNQHIQDLMIAWKEKLEQCQTIFYRAVSFNQNILFHGQNPPLSKTDSRLKVIPFPTKRPTFSEVKRVLTVLSTIEILGNVEVFKSFLLKRKLLGTDRSKSKSKTIDRAKSRSPIRREEPPKPPSSPEELSDVEFETVDTVIDLQTELQEYGDSLTLQERSKKVKKKTKPKVEEFPRPTGTLGLTLQSIENKNEALAKDYISRLLEEFSSEPSLWNQCLDSNSSTLLHVATKYDLRETVWSLLEIGCDPCSKDKSGKYPYNWALTKECRKIYMRFQAEFPDKYDYSKAQVPGPLTKEMEHEKAEKQKALNKIKREKEKKKKMDKKEKQMEIDEKDRFLNLSDREKRALAAERRILGQAAVSGEQKPVLVRCFDCAVDITGKVPFEYNQNVFCTSKCLAVHRKKFPTPLSL